MFLASEADGVGSIVLLRQSVLLALLFYGAHWIDLSIDLRAVSHGVKTKEQRRSRTFER
jgi:hypothetical protein